MPSKRSDTLVHNSLKRPRQDPVSCGFCRSKKLKCDRQQPCSNCAARDLTCDSEPQTRPLTRSPLTKSDNASVLARLKRLEDVVLGRSEQDVIAASTEDSSSPVQAKTTSASSTTINNWRAPVPGYEEAVYSLEEIGSQQTPVSSSSASRPTIKYGISHSLSEKGVCYQQGSKFVFLPPKHDGCLLLERYESRIGDLQHIVHIPSVRAMMDSVYSDLSQSRSVAHSHIALLLSLFASSAALSFASTEVQILPFANSPPSQTSVSWAHAALDVLDYSRCNTSGSLEDVQASMVLGFLLYHLDGFSANLRCLLAGAVAMARDISLHRIDMPVSGGTNHASQQNSLETEIKRRVWWYLASTDWLLALNGGPQERTYLIQPRHMRVNYPRNVNDDDLVHQSPSIDLPLSQPTTMSYYIQRIKLAELSRCIVDLMPLSNLDLSTVDYQEVVALDSRIEAFFHQLPIILKTDAKSRLQSADALQSQPQIQVQRWGLGMIAHVMRCKLHQPFLIRRSLENHYAYSREISLKSARTVIKMKRLLDEEAGVTMNSTVKFTWPIHHVFLATIVLVMDLCFNKDEGDDAARKGEVVDACRILEDAGFESDKAGKLLASLMDVLRRHKVRLHQTESVSQPAAAAAAPTVTTHMDNSTFTTRGISLPESGTDVQWLPVPPNDQSSSYSVADFDAIWNDYVELGPSELDWPQWDTLFSDLDSQKFQV